jgi:hypothetical protein
MEQAGGGLPDHLEGRVRRTGEPHTVSPCGCESTALRIPEVAFVPAAVLTPPRPHEVGDPACGAPQTHQRITDLVVPKVAHGLFKCHATRRPGAGVRWLLVLASRSGCRWCWFRVSVWRSPPLASAWLRSPSAGGSRPLPVPSTPGAGALRSRNGQGPERHASRRWCGMWLR